MKGNNILIVLFYMFIFAYAFLNASNIYYIVLGLGSFIFMLKKIRL